MALTVVMFVNPAPVQDRGDSPWYFVYPGLGVVKPEVDGEPLTGFLDVHRALAHAAGLYQKLTSMSPEERQQYLLDKPLEVEPGWKAIIRSFQPA